MAREISEFDTFSKEEHFMKVEKSYSILKLEHKLKKACQDANILTKPMAENVNEK